MRELSELAARVADLERRMAGTMRHGKVEEVDTKKQLVRLNFGKDVEGKPFLSPWVPYAQVAGAMKIHTPPSKGQQMTLMAPNGDWAQAVSVPMHWSNANKSPSDKGDEHVTTFGDTTITHKGGSIEWKIGGVTVTFSGSGVTIKGGRVEHDDRNIGSDHVHDEVVKGGALTGKPQP